jgi:hypothetical protein
MGNNTFNQNGGVGHQAGAKGKKARAKIIVHNHAASNPERPAITHKEVRDVPGSKRAYLVLMVGAAAATVGSFVLALLPFLNGIGPIVTWNYDWTAYAWAGLGLVALLVFVVASKVIAMMRNQLIALTPFFRGPAVLGRGDRLRRIELSAVCPHDGGEIRFRNGVQRFHYETTANGGVKKVVDKRGPMAVCRREPEEHQWTLLRAVDLTP